MEESIYNIIPKEYVPPPKEPLYKSKFPPNIKPTGSTFGNHTTSKPMVSTKNSLGCQSWRRVRCGTPGSYGIWKF